ncbi:M13-type metalloendopeptidase [Xylocopilactobacillus apis]|uniref:Peptidase M13 n=1 Tax=Xylocopilactobacillus apis TaxID=2932183 RepID=A0AAU9CXJ3_9LACO|nr:M13 family metallopeptidase [Xylocopilactobacillus apis]BDR55993.1 peptidase M13 [Xylocopilactobacillus apis]
MKNSIIPRIQDNLYGAVNGSWQQHAQIRPDRNFAGVTTDIDLKIRSQLIADLKEGDQVAKSDNFTRAAQLFSKARDFERRNREGIDPILANLKKILDLQNLDDFQNHLPSWIEDSFYHPIRLGVAPSILDSNRYQVNISAPETILPDVMMYEHPEQSEPLINLFTTMATNLIAFTPLTLAEQKQFVDDTLAFDRLIASFKLTSVELAEMNNLDHEIGVAELAEHVSAFDIRRVLKTIFHLEPETVNVYDQKYLLNFDQVFNSKTFILWQHWAYVLEIINHSDYLSQEIRSIGSQFNMIALGQESLSSEDEHAYDVTNEIFDEVLGRHYGQKYFGSDSKATVTKLAQTLIKTYRIQLQNNSWLSESTKKKAIKKLETMTLKVGYPEQLSDLYDQLEISPTLSLSKTIDNCRRIAIKYNFTRLNQPVDRTEWGMPAQMVNAQYNSSFNDITILAGILQPPFYDTDSDESTNLGGIGCTIAHEISHAFDNNGAFFDELGNKNDWWQARDYKNFEKYVDKMIQQFDGIESFGGKVNGQLVVSENIADNAGLNAALQLMKNLEHPDYQKFFKNYARSWRIKYRPEFAKILLFVEVHAPFELRTNIPVTNFSEWYEAFNVTSGDRMYRCPEDRLIIW